MQDREASLDDYADLGRQSADEIACAFIGAIRHVESRNPAGLTEAFVDHLHDMRTEAYDLTVAAFRAAGVGERQVASFQAAYLLTLSDRLRAASEAARERAGSGLATH